VAATVRLDLIGAQGISLEAVRPLALAVAAAVLVIAAAPAAAAPSLLHVGDSLAVGSDPPLRTLLPGWSVTTDALENRPTAAGVAIIEGQPRLPDALVVELGTNDSPDAPERFAGYVRHVLELAGPKRCVVWPNIHRPPFNDVSYDALNRALDQIAATSPNLAVVDWNGMVASGQAGVEDDDVHATPDGYRARAAAIAQALEGCTSQQATRGSHTIPAAKKRHTAGPKPRAKPKRKAAAKPKPIKVYTPKPTASAPTPKPAASHSSGTSAWVYVLLGVGLAVILGLAWRWRGWLRNRNLRTPI
jgi:hypothetical protein